MKDHVERLAAALADRYTFERELGAGGMATVYLATQESLNRPVALKVLSSQLATDTTFTESVAEPLVGLITPLSNLSAVSRSRRSVSVGSGEGT